MAAPILSNTTAAWWALAEADAAVLGLVVATLMVGALAYVANRLRRKRVRAPRAFRRNVASR